MQDCIIVASENASEVTVEKTERFRNWKPDMRRNSL